jgi:ABC-type multidrug transport system permease subunit
MSMLAAPCSWLRVIWACAAKEIRSALTERSTLIQSITLPVNYLIMMSLFVLAGSHAPTVVVMHDHGPYARQFVAAMQQAHSFRLSTATAAQARAQMAQGTLVAVVTIPATFDAAVSHHRWVQIPVMINNLDEDLTNDVHRAMGLTVTSFYHHAFPRQVGMAAREHDQYRSDTGYIPFLALSVIVIALMVSGLLQAGTAAAREWEHGTIKELLLSPARRWAVLTGAMLGAFVVSLPAAVVVVVIVIFVVGDHPAHLLMAAGVSLLTLALFVAAGTAVGMAVKDRATLVVLTRAVPVPLFFLSGVFGVLTFQSAAVQTIAGIFPVHYAIVLEQYAFGAFRTGTLLPSTYALILAGYLVAFVCLSAIALRLSRRRAAVSQA